MADKNLILRNAYKKLDQLPLGFGLPRYSDDITDEMIDKYFGIDYSDTVREMKIQSIELVEPDSFDEMMIENRVVYHALRRFRHSSAIFFKFSTAVDGKTVDKTKIPSTIASIIKEYDDEHKKWKGSSIASLWQRGE